jgi:hypothetical protein
MKKYDAARFTLKKVWAVKEWLKYNFRINPEYRESYQLDNIAHIVHVKDSFPIIDKSHISRGRIYDESKLTKTEASVVWLSPFDWPSSIYGNICFLFDFEDLSRGRNLYWVEAIDYPRPAVRFYLTNKYINDIPFKDLLEPYDALTDQGPLKNVKGKWHYNRHTSVEIMLDENIDLDDCKKLEIISHKPDKCRLYKHECKDRSRDLKSIRSQFLAYLIGTSNNVLSRAMTTDIGLPDKRRYHNDLMFPFMNLSGELIRKNSYSGIIRTKKENNNIVVAACLLLSHDQMDRAIALMSLLQSEQVAEKAFERIVQKQFDLQGVRLYPY